MASDDRARCRGVILTIVIAVAVVATLVLVGLRRISSTEAPLDVESEENWLIVHAPARLQSVLRTLDRRVFGGVAVGVAFVLVFVAAAFVGWIFSGVDDQRGLAQWDIAAAEFGRDRATTSTRLLDVVTDLGGTIYLFSLMALVGAFHSVRRRDWGPLLYLAAVGVGITLLNNGLKLVVDRDRPDIAQLAGHAGSSFPSGHSAAAAACWAAIALVVTRRQRISVRTVGASVAVFVAVAVATTRVLLGVHWLSDVVAGVAVGWAWFFVTTVLFGGRLLLLGEPAERMSEHTPAAIDHEETRIS